MESLDSQSYLNSDLLSDVVEAVQAVLQEKQWIPDDLAGNSFFSYDDLWILTSIDDGKRCFDCTVLDQMIFTGRELRSAFPYMRLITANQILALHHPNCRCTLRRITSWADYITLTGD